MLTAVLICIVALPTSLYAYVENINQKIPSSGIVDIIVTVPSLHVNCESVKWGTIFAGANITKTIEINNDGNATIQLSISTEKWTPSTANTYLTFGWNRNGYILQPNETISATIWLKVSANPSITAQTPFCFNIVVNGEKI
jgi:hypothetical protein